MEVSIWRDKSSFSSAIPIFARGSSRGMGLKRKSAAPQRSKPAGTEDQNYYCRLTVELCIHCSACKRLIGIWPNRIKLCPSVALQAWLAEEEEQRSGCNHTNGNGMKIEREEEVEEQKTCVNTNYYYNVLHLL